MSNDVARPGGDVGRGQYLVSTAMIPQPADRIPDPPVPPMGSSGLWRAGQVIATVDGVPMVVNPRGVVTPYGALTPPGDAWPKGWSRETGPPGAGRWIGGGAGAGGGDDDVVAFFAARVDEDEQTARAAGGESWAENGSSVVSAALARGDYSPAGYWVASASWACEGEAENLHEGHATHIARYDPDRALRQVAADRQLLAWHEVAQASSASQREGMSPLERGQHAGAAVMALGLIRSRTEVYSAHPDYREAWSISG